MLLISCPHCGPRDEVEFSCGGQSHIVRPPESASDAEWAAYLFDRDNPRGVHRERWVHDHGCGQWFNIARDTVTHTISAVYPMGESAPGIAGTGMVGTGASL
ncbi:sarcosine oxidase subunit delta [Sphingobium sp. OAS761]|uniref:sarcosine oxidase subunit delta n=1 Tax=Sphingobium sp. OAS761 TaxID=2817901 RepID=UPI0020A12723|nr:sarcosine oxidase subunit delta [Sphingobium sp. OAS761]MCP1469775.1 sarcosine oxidase subunit delta [Sphingobium sp. OAS761]